MLPLCSRNALVVCLAFAGILILSINGNAADKLSPRPAWTNSRIHGAPTPPEPYKVVSAFPNLRFETPSSVEEMPGGKMIVAEIGGRIYCFDKKKDVKKRHLMGDLTKLLPEAQAKNPGRLLLDLTLHPKFPENRSLFVCYHSPEGKPHRRVSRFQVTKANPPTIELKTEEVIISWPTGGHSGGCLAFGNDGMLYISVGDGSGPNPPDGLTTGQDISDLLGSVLRINVDRPSAEGAYVVPSDNPFADRAEARPEIWAYGLRNPWKFSVDSKTGRIFAADNGWETWEMIHEIVKGGNSGWPVMEGRAILRSEVQPGPTPIRPPIKDHPHTEANSVIGGPVYRGEKLRELDGAFIYGDYITGTIWSVQTDDEETHDHRTLVDTDLRIVDFAAGRDGEVFVLDHDFTGQVYELVPNTKKDTSADFPKKVSETGLFTSLKEMAPATGVVAYDVTVDRWVDGAEAKRFVAIPNRETIQLAQGESAIYPEGTVFVKHLSFPQKGGTNRPVETQVLHFEDGRWNPYSYLWNEAGDEAELVDGIGANRVFDLPAAHPHTKPAPRTWHINAQNECKLCHNAGSGFVLGFVANQLDRPLADVEDINQLEALKALGVLSSVPSPESFAASKLVDPHDDANKLDDRARSYLHANCSSCHHPGGNAIISFYLRRDLPFDKLNTNKGTGIGTFGMKDTKIIVPGDPYRSVLMYRMSKLGYARMPYIGSRVVDSKGVALVEDWIRSMPISQGRRLSQPAQETSKAAWAIQVLQGMDKKNRAEALGRLISNTEGSLALAGQMHRGKLAPPVHQTLVEVGKSRDYPSDIRGLFETFVPEAERRPTLGPNAQPQTILAVKGVADRGKLIFYSDSARCRNCHDRSDAEKSLGPTLAEIKKKYPNRSEMLQHILKPSLKIEEKFASYIVLTTSGQVITGMLVKENEKEIVLRTAEKKLITIPRKDIEAIKKADKSLMPDGILADLTAQEAADLLDYFLSLEAKP